MAILVLFLCLLLASCGGGGSSTPTGPAGPTTPVNPNTFTITSIGVNPKAVTVAPGTRVLFVNTDSRPHDMTSDPHPEHDLCIEINSVGLLNPGVSRPTLNLVAVRTCGFHDHNNPPPTTQTGNIWTGRIIIQ